MDLTKFNENYRVVSQEAIEVVYDIILRDDLGLTSEDVIFPDLINSYEEHDEKIWSNEPAQYFIYEGVTEIFQTTSEEELLDEIKYLAEKLDLKTLSITESQAYKQLKKLLQEEELLKKTNLEDWTLMNYEGYDDLVLGFAGNEDSSSALVDYELHMFRRDGFVEVEVWKDNYLVNTYDFPIYKQNEMPLNLEREMLIEDFIDELLSVPEFKNRIIDSETSNGTVFNDKEVDKLADKLGVEIIER